MKPDQILKTLVKSGYEAYYVGGCVRDSLLGRQVHDWDITTAARPEQVMVLFDHCVPTGIEHGTVTVFLEDTSAEVTTFRCDGDYSDARHPESVEFVTDLSQDLCRRDFTINAMAMSLDGRMIDLFGGREDLQAGLVRCVGDARQRFGEDALRMLRAHRFCAQLGFSLESKTEAAVLQCASLCANLSRERVREEVEKTLLSERPQMVKKMIEVGLLQQVGLTQSSCLDWLQKTPANAPCRWTALKILIPDLDLQQLRLSKKLSTLCDSAASCWQQERTRLQWKQLIAKEGIPCAQVLADLCGQKQMLDEILQSGECVSLSQLGVSGADFQDLPGKQIGEVLQRLLQHVLQAPHDNDRQILLELAKNLGKTDSAN